MQANLANTYSRVGRQQEALQMERDIYAHYLKRNGEEDESTLAAANNYAASLMILNRFKDASALYRKTVPIARRVLGEGHEFCLGLRTNYGRALCQDYGATLDDLREAVATLVEADRTARRVMGGAHPLFLQIEDDLRAARAVLAARETPPDAA